MKGAFCALTLIAILLCGSAGAADKPVNDLTITITEASRSGNIAVELGNSSKEPIRVWRESNSWGAAHWRILLLRNGQLKTFFQNPDEAFSRNFPAFDEIAERSHIDKRLDLNNGNWRGVGDERVEFELGDVIIVIYDAPKVYGWTGAKVTVQARDMNVWYGVVTATTTVK